MAIRLSKRFFFLECALLLSAASVWADSLAYTAIEISGLSGNFIGMGINASGQVVGDSALPSDPSTHHVFVYTPGRGLTDLGTLGGYVSDAGGINDIGQVTGDSRTAGNAAVHAFLYTPGKGMMDIGTLGGFESTGTGINAGGEVTGYSDTDTYSVTHAFLYTAAGGMTDLGTLMGINGHYSEAYGINNRGQVTGVSSIADDTIRAFLYTPGTGMTDLGTLGGSYGSSGYAINASGQVTGFSYTNGEAVHAFLYTPGGVMQDLGTLGGNFSQGEAINDSGQITGFSTNSNGELRAFLYSGAKMYDLTSLVTTGLPNNVYLEEAEGINDSGWIIAQSADNDCYCFNAYLLEPTTAPMPVPEAGTLTLSGIAAVIWLILSYSFRGSGVLASRFTPHASSHPRDTRLTQSASNRIRDRESATAAGLM